MSLLVQFRPEAEIDLIDAADWYEEQNPGLGAEFLDQILNACETISTHPELHAIVYKSIRRAVIQKFPFGIFYRVHDKRILV